MKTAMDAYELPRLMPTMGGVATCAGDSARPLATGPFCGMTVFFFASPRGYGSRGTAEVINGCMDRFNLIR